MVNLRKKDEKAGQFYWDTRPLPDLASAVIKSWSERAQRERDRETATAFTAVRRSRGNNTA